MNSPQTPHLTHEQFCDLILAGSPHPLSSDFATLEQHLCACPSCSEELTRLSRSLTLFREASSGFAQQQLAEIRAHRTEAVLPAPHTLARPLYWASAAVLALAVLAPFGLQHGSARTPAPDAAAITTSSHTQESDEALLEEIDQDISASVPSSMRPLVDPVASTTATSAGNTAATSQKTAEN